MSTKKTPTRPSRKTAKTPEIDARAELDKLAINPVTGELWLETAPEWHIYLAAAYSFAFKATGVSYFEGCAEGHANAVRHLYAQMGAVPE